jgi:hypothetical protein
MKNTLKERWLKTKTHLESLEDKYFDLVWLARKDTDELLNNEQYEILNTIKNIEEKYPTEVDELTNDNTTWHHGFNSGMLAAIRLFDGLMSEDEDALDDFPNLDT